MDRRKFLGSLFALPAAVKAVVLKPDLFTYHKINEWQAVSGSQMDEISRQFALANQRMMQEIFEHVAKNNPYSNIVS